MSSAASEEEQTCNNGAIPFHSSLSRILRRFRLVRIIREWWGNGNGDGDGNGNGERREARGERRGIRGQGSGEERGKGERREAEAGG